MIQKVHLDENFIKKIRLFTRNFNFEVDFIKNTIRIQTMMIYISSSK